MPPVLALTLTVCFAVLLFRWDRKTDPDASRALWIPFWWIVIACSREVSEWFELTGFELPGGSLEEGNPVNRLFYIVLIALGFSVLRRRRVTSDELAKSNVWLAFFLGFCLLAVLWSDYPFVSLKRWIKVVGHPIMALIVLTEPQPARALVQLVKRCAFIVVPGSVLFIKYYPVWGRGFDRWIGKPFNTGITTDKNALGINCLIIGFVLVWHLLQVLRWEKGRAKRLELGFCVVFLAMNSWLFSMAHSKTPLVSYGLSLFVLFFCGFSWVDKRRIGLYALVIVLMLAVAQWTFDIYGSFLRVLGKDPTLTDRTEVWADLLKIDINPIIGTGFESFWLGERLEKMWQLWTFRPNQAHNGYLETYLNLGLIGLLLLLGLLVASFAKAQRCLLINFEWGRFRLGFLAAIIVYNWTEAAFKTTHPIFFMFYIIAIDLPARHLIRNDAEPQR